MLNLIPCGLINENGVHQTPPLFEIGLCTESLRLSSFIVSEDIISILLDQNFVMNVIGMVLESNMICLKNEHSACFANSLFFTLMKIL